MMKRPSLGRSSQKTESLFSNHILENNKSSCSNEINNFNNINNNEDNNITYKIKKKNSNKNSSKAINPKTFNRLKSSKFSFKNTEERNNKNFRIIKEIFDPEKYVVSEEELFRQGEGYCFGEWALIYREPRSASIYTLEDCVFFTLDEIHFRNSFLKSLNNSEYSKKKFALQNFLPFDMMDERQLSIYKNIIPITCNRNQVIFKEGEKSDSIYLIYLGSFTLEKKYGVKQFRVLNLERGSIVGLESIFEGENSKYKCSMKLSNGLDVGLIFQLKINRLRPYIINKMKVSFKTNYQVFLKSWNDLFHKNVFISQKLSKEKICEVIGCKKNNEYLNFDTGNDNLESNNDLFKKKWNSVLNIEPEDKFEILFKNCLKQNSYKNHKNDGSLRIFSSRQRNKINEANIFNKNSYSKYLYIIKYFENNTKFDIENNISKNQNSCRNKKIKNLINESIDNNQNDNKFIQNNLNLTENKTNIILIENEDNEKANNKICLNKKKFNNKLQNNNYIKPKPLKLNKNLLLETNITKFITPKNDFNRNKYIKIHFKSHSLINKNEIVIIKKNIDKKRAEEKEKKNININNECTIVNNNLIIQKPNNYLTFRKYPNNRNKNLSRNNSILKNNNISKENDIFYKNLSLNSPFHLKRENKILFNKFYSSNPSKLLKKKKLFKTVIFSEKKFENRRLLNENENIRNSSETLQKNLSSINSRVNIYKYIKKNNLTHRNKKLHNFRSLEENKDFLQEMNKNNGFYISYFEKNNCYKNINRINYSDKNRPFPSDVNFFKISFDSGAFKIPLITSSMKLKKL